MYKNLLLYFTAFTAIAIYALAENETFMRFFISKVRISKNPAIRMDKSDYGDLYAMSFLKDYKVQLMPLTDSLRRQPDTVKTADLAIIGDSYLAQLTKEMADSVFYKTSLNYFYYPLAEGGRTQNILLTGTSKKILLIERTERFFREEFSEKKSAAKYLNFFKIDTVLPNDRPPITQKNSANTLDSGQKSNPFSGVFKFKWNNPTVVNQNLETIIFGYGLFTKVKEIKAGFNYRIFNRVNPSVYPSPDKKNLYLSETIDPHSNLSSFKPLTAEEQQNIVLNMNFIGEEYKKKGFDEVVFSLIPNAVTVTDPDMGVYNNLIDRIQNDPLLKVPIIDIYSVYKNEADRKSLYRRSDTHWNAKGFGLWIKELNIFLKKVQGRPF